ncbi:11801_t:CDS:2, partial [Entrophospora sp. SA101]
MQYFRNCVYAATLRKTTPEIVTPTDEELFHVQVDGLVAHLSGDHSLCWDEAFRKMPQESFTLNPQQSLVIHICTSYNESLNREKNIFLDKKIDFWQSFAACHSLTVIHHNEGLLETIKKARLIAGLEDLTFEDIENIKKIANTQDSQRARNVERIQERNRERSERIMQQNQELISFDFDQDLILYGKEFQRKMIFPKASSSGLCRACNFYLKHNMYNRFPDKSLQLPDQYSFDSSLSHTPPPPTSKDTMILLPTGGGKTLCYSASALLCEGLTVVFSPLKALIDDQVIEVTKMGIPCADLYTSNGKSASHQKKVFEELLSGFTKILVTPENFDKNIGFQKMLHRIYEKFGLCFVIDEAHSIKEYRHFRPSWSNLGKLRNMFQEAPIMMLAATCFKEDANIIINSLNIKPENLNIIRSSSFSRPEIKIEVCSKGAKEKII